MEYNKRPDVRANKTKTALKAAIFVLLSTTTFERLTVRQICDAALINRVTFYSHYSDKFDLFNDALNDLVESVGNGARKDIVKFGKLTAAARIRICCNAFLEALINVCYENKAWITNLNNPENSMIIFMFNQSITKRLSNYLEEFEKDGSLNYSPDRVASFTCGGVSRLIFDWLSGGNDCPDKETFTCTLQKALSDLLSSNILFH
ncbi:MAG: TetR/AcrR family transcriptional regulator [Clostridiaceae bacterium]|jgi:AcrR family transcriptional regulator|nr:TetR/AcrR family transcriptional regulator [Clostridiaceae bacterium]